MVSCEHQCFSSEPYGVGISITPKTYIKKDLVSNIGVREIHKNIVITLCILFAILHLARSDTVLLNWSYMCHET